MDIRFNEGDGRIACGITEILTEIALEWLAENKNAKLFHVAVACIGMAEGFSKRKRTLLHPLNGGRLG